MYDLISTYFSLIGGIDPSKSLSVTLDVGTNNENLLNDNLYVVRASPNFLLIHCSWCTKGWPQRRIQGEAYDKFVDRYVCHHKDRPFIQFHVHFRFVQLVRKYYPHCLLHFEDFGVTNAHRILDRYHDTHAVFNDDMLVPRSSPGY